MANTASTIALNAEQQRIADMFGNSAEDLAKYGGFNGLDAANDPADQMALNAEARKIADMFGNSAEDIAKYGK